MSWLAQRRSQPKLAGLAMFMDSVEGVYFLRRGIFLPKELPVLMGADLAQEGLKRLGSWPPGCTGRMPVMALQPWACWNLLSILRNQLLRDSDWASMGHSLELRTPLVDAKLLECWGPMYPTSVVARVKVCWHHRQEKRYLANL